MLSVTEAIFAEAKLIISYTYAVRNDSFVRLAMQAHELRRNFYGFYMLKLVDAYISGCYNPLTVF